MKKKERVTKQRPNERPNERAMLERCSYTYADIAWGCIYSAYDCFCRA